MEKNDNNLLATKLLEFIQKSNFYLYALGFSVFIAFPIIFNKVRENIGVTPILISLTVAFLLVMLRFSIKNSVNYFSYKLLLAILMTNTSIVIILGSLNYFSSSSFSFDYSLSGKSGEFLAKWPTNWSSYNANFLNYIDLFFRAIIPLIILLVIYNPSLTKKILLNLLIKSFRAIFVSIKRINIKNLKLKKKEDSNYNQELVDEIEGIAHKEDVEEKVFEPSYETNKDSEKDITLSDRNITTHAESYEIKKEIIYQNELDNNDVDQFKIQNYKWPKIKTSGLMVSEKQELSKNEINDTKEIIINTLSAHGVNTTIENHTSGPSVTMYQLKPGWIDGQENKRVKVEQVLRREKDLALSLGSPNIRFEAVLDGVQNSMGIEIPNLTPNNVDFKEIIENEKLRKNSERFDLPAPLGQGMNGNPVVIDLAKMPHLLVAGSTGSGKSVFINSLIAGLITTKTPEQVRMILIDPKRVELTPYSKVPHLYTDEVIVDTDKAVSVLSSTVNEMMRRFKILEKVGVKNISDFNLKMNKSHKMWNIVVIIDELADLMLQAGNEIERLIVRLAQLGRATGIHLVVATQRPSVDVVTGLIKANFPSRVSFAVMSQIDSRTVLDSIGAEKLIGKGDMLFSPIDSAQMLRIQGAFLTENDIKNLTDQWEDYFEKYSLKMLELEIEENIYNKQITGDSLYDQALDLSTQSNTLSTSLLQRRLRIGYPRAARLMDELEENGIVGPGEAGKPRRVLVG